MRRKRGSHSPPCQEAKCQYEYGVPAKNLKKAVSTATEIVNECNGCNVQYADAEDVRRALEAERQSSPGTLERRRKRSQRSAGVGEAWM